MRIYMVFTADFTKSKLIDQGNSSAVAWDSSFNFRSLTDATTQYEAVIQVWTYTFVCDPLIILYISRNTLFSQDRFRWFW